jgi:hypothetical protein
MKFVSNGHAPLTPLPNLDDSPTGKSKGFYNDNYSESNNIWLEGGEMDLPEE